MAEYVRSLKEAGFDPAGQAIDTTAAQLAGRIKAANLPKDQIDAQFKADAFALVEKARVQHAKMDPLRTALIKAQAAIDGLRLNAQTAEANRQQTQLDGFSATADLVASCQAAETLANQIEAIFKQHREQALGTVSVEQVRADLATLNNRVETYFAHFRGERRTSKDKTAGTSHDRRAIDALDIPHDALEDLELRIKTAQLLADSGSVEAAKEAQAEITKLTAYFDHIEQHRNAIGNVDPFWQNRRLYRKTRKIDGQDRQKIRLFQNRGTQGLSGRTERAAWPCDHRRSHGLKGRG